eukprot:4778435-Pyramimonas_sp.AAC.1
MPVKHVIIFHFPWGESGSRSSPPVGGRDEVVLGHDRQQRLAGAVDHHLGLEHRRPPLRLAEGLRLVEDIPRSGPIPILVRLEALPPQRQEVRGPARDPHDVGVLRIRRLRRIRDQLIRQDLKIGRFTPEGESSI